MRWLVVGGCNARWLRCWVDCRRWAAGEGRGAGSGRASQREMHPRRLANRHMASRDHGCGHECAHGCVVDDEDAPGAFDRSLSYRIALEAPRLVVYKFRIPLRCTSSSTSQQTDPTTDTTGPTLPLPPPHCLPFCICFCSSLEIGETVVLFSIVDFLQCPEHSREILDAQVSTVNRVCVCVCVCVMCVLVPLTTFDVLNIAGFVAPMRILCLP